MFVKDTRLQIALTLLVVSLLSIFRFLSLQIIATFVILLGLGQLIDISLNYATKKKYFLSYSALVTSLLVFLIVDRNSAMWIPVIALLTAIFSKHLLRIGPRHIFNPAALGITAASIVSQTIPSWWGSSWAIFLPLIIIFGSFPVLKRLRRLYIVLGFLLIYILYISVSTHHLNFLFFLDGTLILFSFIMLPEPQTSPVMGHWIKTFGIFIGFLTVVFSKLLPQANFDPLLLALLSGNLFSVVANKFSKSV